MFVKVVPRLRLVNFVSIGCAHMFGKSFYLIVLSSGKRKNCFGNNEVVTGLRFNLKSACIRDNVTD